MEPLFERLKHNAVSHRKRIVLPESTEPRTLQAADRLIADGVADVIFVGKADEIAAAAAKDHLLHIGKATVIDPSDASVLEPYAQLFFEIRKNKGITMEEARAKAQDPLYFGCLLIKHGDADGMVSGAINATSSLLRAAFQTIKTKPGITSVSGAFIMLLPEGSPYGDDGIMVFADCAVIPEPKAEELAQIAVSSAVTARSLAGIEPRIAMLSFSTKGSAKHENIDKVVEATRLALEMEPTLQIDGELQADAALVPSVGAQKAPGSAIAGHANVLVFPDLGAGNIGYKLVQRLGGAKAVGPILQGLAAPVNDLSRGCSSDDIYRTVIITCNQAINS